MIVKPQGDLKLTGRTLLLGVGLGRGRGSDQGSVGGGGEWAFHSV